MKETIHCLAAEWLNHLGPSSNPAVLTSHPAFRRIVNLGRPAVPYILREVKAEPSLLVLALHEITGENPVPRSAKGRLGEMARAWVAWGETVRVEDVTPVPPGSGLFLPPGSH